MTIELDAAALAGPEARIAIDAASVDAMHRVTWQGGAPYAASVR
jgi:hypothetical protein